MENTLLYKIVESLHRSMPYKLYGIMFRLYIAIFSETRNMQIDFGVEIVVEIISLNTLKLKLNSVELE